MRFFASCVTESHSGDGKSYAPAYIKIEFDEKSDISKHKSNVFFTNYSVVISILSDFFTKLLVLYPLLK